MSIQVVKKIYSLFDELISEYIKEKAIFNKDPTQYIKNSDFMLGGTLNPSSKEEFEEIQKRQENDIPTVQQLHKNNRTVQLTNDIAEFLSKSNQLNYLPSEIASSVDKITFDFINRIVCLSPIPEDSEQKNILKTVIGEHISKVKNESDIYEFRFPVHILGLDDNLNLNERIYLEANDKSLIDTNKMEKYLFSRAFEPNYNICISSKTKSSYKYSEERAIRAKNTTLNILLVLYGCRCGNNSWVSPIVKTENQKQHFFNYFHSAKKGEAFEESSSYKFSYNNDLYKKFWAMFNNSFSDQANLHKLLFSIPDRVMSNVNFNKSVCSIIERSLKWFSDAIDEQDSEIKIVKLAIAIESLVNFKGDSKSNDLENDRFKKMFVDRVRIINESDSDAGRKATELYNARSSVAHGSPLKNRFDFDVVRFTATTLLLSIQLFSLFEKNGLDEMGFSKKLPKFIDDYPNSH
ncbi:HEPN domain-containing protein [Psychromonas sp. SR45-3]|uniref:HEPN domain-containing protein n=1 Tax=Psychromonas sp. SR45-3 TaxID=2760930 RepID=UPI0015FD8E48|nr:HEPN domain-containing protein [Psychromonas sp. SR45-3]MBB1274068.1 hypothetical protein [Psychromonas sp. SR45-3]